MPDVAPTPRLIDGPPDAAASLLLAHGAGAPMDSPFMQVIARGLSQRGWRVVRFEFPYMARRRSLGRQQAPDRQPVLLEAWRQQVREAAGEGPLFIGGKSMGGRMASLLLAEISGSAAVRGCLCLGYPFHPPGKPQQLRIEHLLSLTAPCLIVQGERDSFGSRSEVAGYALPESLELQWIPDGDHSFKPRKQSGWSEASNLELAIQHCHRFMASFCPDRSDGSAHTQPQR